MSWYEAAIEAVRNGAWVAPWTWNRLLAVGSGEVLDAILDRLAHAGAIEPHVRLARQLVRLTGDQTARALLTEPRRAEALVELLAVQPAGGYLAPYASYPAIDYLEVLCDRAGEAAVPPLRELLRGPSRGAVALPEPGSPLRWRGPRLSAVGLVGRLGRAEDHGHVARLAADPHEGELMRLCAGTMLQVHFSHRDPAEALAEVLHELPYDDSSATALDETDVHSRRLSALGAGLVAPAASCLSHPEFVVRERAYRYLRDAGPVGAEIVGEVARTSSDWRAQQRAKELLWYLDVGLLDVSRRQRASEARGLSFARDTPDSDRGLSRSEPGQREGPP